MRRALIILAIVIVLLGGGVWAYFAFFAASSAGVVVSPGGSTTLPTSGQNSAVSPGETAGAASTTPTAPAAVTSRLVKISEGPVVPGEVVINNRPANASSSPETLALFIERQSGNIYSYNTLTRALTRTSNKTIPGIQSASWFPSGSFSLVRYLSGADFSTINTYALPSVGGAGFFLSQNLSGVDTSPTSILSLSSGVNGSSASIAHPDGTHSVEVFTTPLSSVRASFAGKKYLVFTKPSSSLVGDAFLVDSAGRFSRVAGPMNGLVALASPSGEWLLVSYVLGTTLQMELVNTTTNSSVALPVATIADKCVWTNDSASIYCGIPVSPPASNYPDDWYQGVVHFSDRIWKINAVARYAQLVLDFNTETGGTLDAEALAIDPLATNLVFVNKNDGALWGYSL